VIESAGGSNSGTKNENLPDWDEELKEELEKEKEEVTNVHSEIVSGLQQISKKDDNGGNPTAESEGYGAVPNAVVKGEAMAKYDDAEFSVIESITRNVLCCSSTPDKSKLQVTSSAGDPTAMQQAEYAHAESYHPRWYNRSHGWEGTTYAEAVTFCASQTSEDDSNAPKQLCPYEVYCPTGAHSIPLGGYRGHEADVEEGNNTRSPISDYTNGWVRVGSENSCVQYTVLDPEDDIGALMKGSGMNGANAILDELIGKEEKVSQEVVNEEEAPSAGVTQVSETQEESAPTPLQHQAEPESGLVSETYVPVHPSVKPGPSAMTEELVAIEQELEQEEAESVDTSGEQNNAEQKQEPIAEQPASQPQNPVQESTTPAAQVQQEVNMNAILHKKFKPMWLTALDGWTSGSHDDAATFCKSVRGKQLCPYSAMCPEGPGGMVMGGRHALELRGISGVQYAPIMGKENHWVMIGDNGDGTKCKTHRQLEGKAPEWGLNGDRKEVKQHIMCCTV
jgi:hypothetical protein